MKVCTDACILGAWFAEKIPSYSMVLDIGSGTGLLMLMLAQKNHAEIHGIELELECFKQLKENISQNKWKDRLRVFPGDVRNHSFADKYDFIISNPPFFENDLQSVSDQKNIAKHSSELTLEDILKIINENLASAGTFGILLPWHRVSYFEELATQYNFHVAEKLLVRQTPQHDYFRCIIQFSRTRENFTPAFELTIHNEQGDYTEEFIELMKDYYLHI